MSAGSSLRIGSLFITGANRGIGLEFVKQLTRLPQPPRHIFATCRNPSEAKDLLQLASKHNCVHILKLDVSNTSEYPSLVKTVETTLDGEGLNVIVNNAGMAGRVQLEDVTETVMMEHYRVNAVAPLLLIQAFLPLLKKAASTSADVSGLSCARAAIINITTKVASIDDNKSGGGYPYRASKVALNIITKSLSVDLKPHGILAVVLHPGWVQTEMGGPNALISTETSVSGLLRTMQGLNEETSGSFFNYDGTVIPW